MIFQGLSAFPLTPMDERGVEELVEDAQVVGAAALLLAPVSYQPLRADEVLDRLGRLTRTEAGPPCTQ